MKKTGRQPQSQNRFRCKVVATAVAACFAADIAFANPTGPVVVNGQVSFARAGSVLSVTNSPSSIINWQQFSIAGGETTRFIQQSAASAVLNRVVGGDPSSILGTLQSNGRVFLINPSGIMFGAGSQIDVAGLVASTLRLSNEDFLTGRMNFVADPAHAAAVVNQGRISASPGGQVYLVGTAVDNQGVITAPNGDIVLAAGNSVRVTEGAGSQLQVEIRAPADSAVNLSEAVYGSRGIYGGLVRNSGTISANSVVRTAEGRIVLKASGDVTLAAGSSTTANGASGGTVTVEAGNAVTVSGAVEAIGDSGAGGRIALNAANELTLDTTSTVTAIGASGGAVTVQSETGTLVAQGVIEAKGSDGPGGAIRLLGERVALLPGMRVDASGEAGGGVVLVGGDYQGGNPEVKNSTVTYVGGDVSIKADAVSHGDGGKVIVWADDTTRYFGSISARGGSRGGNGGFVEVSGKEMLLFRGRVDTRAPQGNTGTLLLDPANIVISDGSGDSVNDADALSASFAGSGSGTGVVVSGDNPVAGTLTLFQSEVEGIASTTNISLQATSAITINDLSNNNLNLAQAGGNSVAFNSAVFHMDASDTITTAGGALSITTTGTATVGGLNTAGGAITLNLGGASTVSGVIAGTATTLTKSGAGTLTLSGANTYTGLTTVSAGVLNLRSNTALGTTAAGTTVASGAALELQGGITVGAETLSIAGTGVGGNGALRNISGANTWGGTLTQTAASEIQSDAGTLILNAANSVTGAFALTVDGAANTAISGTITTGAGTLTKNGTGTLTLSGANTYTGVTTVSVGTVVAASNTALGSAAGATTVASGAELQISGNGLTIAEPITSLIGTGVSGSSALRNLANSNTWTGAITLGAGGARINSDAGTLTLSGAGNITGAFPLTLGGAGDIAISKVIATAAGTLTKDGAGTLTLSGTNTYTGATTVSAGVLSVQNIQGTGTTAGGVTVASGAALELQGGIVVGAEALNLSGTGIGGNGALRNISGTNTWGGAVTLGAGGAEIQSDAGTLTVASVTGATQNLTVDGAANTTITGVISTATGALTKNGAGTLTLSGVNTYTGATTINAGTLALDATGTIAQSSGVANNNATLTVAASKTIDSMTGAGATTISAGILTIGDASNTTATYDGVISGAGGLTKAGTGTLTLTGASDYTGATVVNAGVLNLRSNTALGTTAAGTTVASGAALELQGGITVGAETLSIAGTGVGGNGALRNISGTNTWGGTVTQTAASEIQSDAGTLILNAANSVTGAFALTVDGAANTAISGTITTGAGTLIKNGAGTLTLSGANTYTGATTVSGGALTFSGLNGAAASSSGFTVNQGSTLTLDNSGTNNTDRIAGTLAMNGGEFVVTGNSGAQTTELIGALTLNSGHSIITLTPHAAQNLQITFPSLTRTAGATGLFRGTNLGANTIASNTAGASNIVFSTTNPTLTGAGGAIGSTTMSIVKGAIGAGGAGGSTSLGADFLFYDDATNGLRPLTAAEYQTPVLDATALTAGANVKLAVNRNADDTQSINSLLLSGGVTYNHDNALGTNTLTLGAAARSGNVLSIGAANTIQSTQAGGVLAFGTAAGNEANIFTVADLTLGSNVAIVAATSTGGMTKSGPGVLLENRATTFTGGLFVNEGTLRSGTNAAFASQVLNVRAAGTFNLDTFTNTFTTLNLQSGSTRGSSVTADTVTPGTLTLTTTPAAIVHTLNGDGAAGATISGNLVLPAISTITVANGAATDDLAVSAIISGAATSLGKAGAGTLVLSNANTYAGATNVTAGTLNIRNALGTGTIAGGVVISNNAALELQGGITVGAEALSIVGTGVGANGALRNISGTNTWGGTVTQTAASEIQSDAGTLTLNAANSVTGAFNLTVDGAASTAISGTITTGAGTLTKNGTGTLTLSGTNTYTGATTVSAGVLNVQNIQGTGTTAGGVTVASGAALELQGGIAVGAETLSIAGTGVGGNGALRNISGANTWGGAVTQTAASEIQSDAGTLTLSSTAGGAFALTVDGAADTAMSGVVGGAGALSLVKNGTGTLTLSGANNYTGATTVNAGVLNLQNATATGTVAGGVTIASGAVLELQGGIVVGAEALTLSGTGIGGNGALRNISGANTWGGAITLASDTRINSDLNTLILSGGVNNRGNLLTVGGAGNTTFTTTAITGAGGLTKDGAGTTTLSFANTSSGATTISGGTLTLGVANAAATSSGIANSGNLTLGANNIIDSMTGSGTTTLGTFALTIGDASNTSSTYDGVISGTGGITKAGTGTLTLTGDNSYSGLTTISTGTLQLGAAGGATNTPLGTVAAGTIVSNGATLDLNGFTLGTSEALTLNGTGISGGGALTNSSGTGAAYSGLITLGSASSIVAGNGNIVISNTGTITGAGFGLTLGGTNAASSIASIIGTTTGTLIKEGSGTWTLSGTNTYTGATAVDAGTLKLSGGTAIADTGVVRLASGTTLDLTGSSETIGLLSNNTAGGIVTSSAAGAVTLTTGVEANSTFAGVIQDGSGTVALSKTGTGTLTLSGANTYGGVTNINAGTLIAANDNALGSTAGGTSVSSGATLNINSVANGGEAIFISGNGAGGVGALTGTGTASLGVAGTLTLTGASRIGTTSGASTLTLGGAVSAGGNTLDITGAGNLTATNALDNFGAVTINSAGSVSLVDTNALTISALTVGTLTAQTLSGDLILGGNITATGTGDTIVLAAAANFDNSGGYSLVPNTGGGGRWLIYSTNPASDNRGGLGYNFKQYNATYGVTLVAGSGNGFLYTLAPTITPTLQGAITKTYDGYTAATLAAGNYKSTGIGEIDGDTVVLNNPATGVYASAHAGSGILVTADSASTFASASNGAAAVYGYQVSGTPASGSVGTITPVALSGSATIAPVAKAYDGFTVATGSTISGTTGGTVNGDTVALNTLGYTLDHSSAHAGATTITASGNAALGAITSAAVGTGDGSAGNRAAAIAGDYTLTLPATVTNQGVASSITPVALSGSATIAPVAKAYDGFTVATGSTISGTTGGTVNGDTVALNTLGYTLDHSSAHAGATTITASGNAALGAITSAAVGTGDGSAGNRAAAIAGDYTLTLPATVTNQGVASSITPVALSGSATIAPVAKAYDGFTVATGSTISGTTGGTVNGDTVALNTLGYTLDHSSAHAGATTITASGNAALGAITSAAVGTGDGSAGNRAAAIAGDYTLTLPATVTNQGVASSITPVALSGSATIAPVAKAYDGFTVATGSTISGTTGGTVNGDTVALNTLGYTLDHSSAHAGATTITASGNAALGAITSAAVGTGDGSAGNRAAAIAGDYTLTLPATVTNQGVASSITPVALSGSATIAPVAKAYDGFTVATGSTISGTTGGTVNGDTVALNTLGYTLDHSSAHAGATTITASGNAALGAITSAAVGTGDGSAGNRAAAIAGDYTLTLPATVTNQGVASSITPVALSGSATIAPVAKAYDGFTVATGSTISGTTGGTVNGDTVALNTLGYTLDHSSAHAGATTITASGNAALGAITSAAVGTGDGSAGNRAAAIAGDYTLTLPATVTNQGVASSITPVALSGSATIAPVAKAYDGFTVATGSTISGTTGGTVNGDTVALNTLGYTLDHSSAHAGATTITASGNAALGAITSAAVGTGDGSAGNRAAAIAGDYTLTLPATVTNQGVASSITPVALSGSATIAPVAKAYDGFTVATGSTISGTTGGTVNGDTVALNTLGYTLDHSSAHAGATTITASGNAALGAITSAAVGTGDGSAGNRAAAIAGDYTLTLPATVTNQGVASSITPVALSGSATIAPVAKAYDGFTVATGSTISGTTGGTVNGDTVALNTLGYTLDHSSAHAGATTITASGNAALGAITSAAVGTGDGSAGNRAAAIAGDYTLTLPATVTNQGVASSITPVALSGSATIAPVAKAYDGFTVATGSTISGTTGGTVNGDTVALNTLGYTLDHSSAHAGATTITASGNAALGAITSAAVGTGDGSAGNRAAAIAGDYTLTLPATVTNQGVASSITPVALSGSATIAPVAKAYDGFTVATGSTISGTTGGTVNGDTVALNTLGYTLDHSSAHAGATTITASGNAALGAITSAAVGTGDGSAGNRAAAIAGDYTLTLPATVTNQGVASSITPVALSGSATIAPVAKAYDGFTVATGSTISGTTGGTVNGDTVALNTLGYTLDHSSAHAGATTITASGNAALGAITSAAVGTGDGSAGNRAAAIAGDYTLTLPATVTNQGVASSITPVALSGSATIAPVAKAYDGFTVATGSTISGTTGGTVNGDTVALNTLGYTLDHSSAHAGATTITASGNAALGAITSAAVGTGDGSAGNRAAAIAGDYTLTLPATVTNQGVASSITPVALSGSATIAPVAKAYDGFTVATGSTISGTTGGTVNGDTVALNTLGYTLDHSSAHAGATTITASGNAALGAITSAAVGTGDGSAGNRAAAIAGDYTLTLPATVTNQGVASSITPVALSGSATIAPVAKAYDGFTVATGSTISGTTGGTVNGDTVALNTLGYTLDHSSAHAGATTITASGNAALGAITSAAVGTGDGSAGNRAAAIAGDYTLTLPATVTNQGVASSITPVALSGSATIAPVAKAYDGFTVATGSTISGTTGGTVNGDTVALNTLGYTLDHSSAHAGATTITASGNAALGAITSAAVGTGDGSAGNRAAAIAGDYTLTLPATVTNQGVASSITPVALSGSATIAPVAKAYDGFTVATGSTISGTTGGTVNGDTVALNTLGYTLDHSSAHAGATTITASGNAALGAITSAAVGTGDGSAGNRAAAIAGDYTLTLPATVTNQGVASSITPVALSGSATIAPVAKAYDGFTVATGSTISGTTGGTVNGDTVALNTLGYTLDHSSAHAGATTITASGNAALGAITSAAVGTGDGSAGNRAAAIAGDYTLTLPATVTNQGVASSITPKTVDLAGTRAYDSTVNFAASAFTPTITGTVGGETLTIASGTGTVPVNGVAAGTQTLNTGTLALGNGTGLASDYTFSGGSHTGAITPWALSITADDKSRLQGTPNPPFTATYGSFQGGDTPASLTGTLSFSTPAVIGSPAGPYPITPLGQSSTNYTITYVNGTLVVSGGIIVPTQPPASKPDAINLVVNGFYQLGDGLAQRSLADCSSVSVWAPWACGNQGAEQVTLVVAPAVTGAPPLNESGAAPRPAPEVSEFLALRPAPELMTTPAPLVTETSASPQLAPDVAAVPVLRPTLELATSPGPRTPKYNDVMTAVMNRDRATVVELLDFGWWVDRPDSNGLTPLMAAALNGDATMTELLLQRGADPNRRAAGRSVLDYAARGGDSKVMELLRRAGAK